MLLLTGADHKMPPYWAYGTSSWPFILPQSLLVIFFARTIQYFAGYGRKVWNFKCAICLPQFFFIPAHPCCPRAGAFTPPSATYFASQYGNMPVGLLFFKCLPLLLQSLSPDYQMEELLKKDDRGSDEISEKYLRINGRYITDGQVILINLNLFSPCLQN